MYGCDSVAILDLTITGKPVAIIAQNGVDLVVTVAITYFWSTSETTQVITPATNGWYWCVVSDVNGCVSDTAFYEVTDIGTAIDEENINELKIYPNPTNSMLYLSEKVEYKIYNILNEIILIGNDNIIDLSSFNNGIYIVESENVRTKIIKE